MELKFIGNNDGPSIEQYLVAVKHCYGKFWRYHMILTYPMMLKNGGTLMVPC